MGRSGEEGGVGMRKDKGGVERRRMREKWRGVGGVGMGRRRKEWGGVERSGRIGEEWEEWGGVGRSGEEWGEVRSGEEED